jgi:DNA repair protein RadC
MKTNLEKYIKMVKQEILNNDMEIVPVTMMINQNEAIIIMEYFAGTTPYKTAKRINRTY